MSSIVPFCRQKPGLFALNFAEIAQTVGMADFSQRSRIDKNYVVLDRNTDPKFPTFKHLKSLYFCVSVPLASGEFTVFVAIKNNINSKRLQKERQVQTYIELKGQETTAICKPILRRVVEKHCYRIFELCNRGSLEFYTERSPILQNPLAKHLIGYKIISALRECHEMGVIHRDIKASNLLLKKLGDGTISVQLTDFGNAFLQNKDTLEEATKFRGDPIGISNEELHHYHKTQQLFPADFRRDLWAFGSLLYQLETDEYPRDDCARDKNVPLGIFQNEIVEILYSKRASCPSLDSIQARMYVHLKQAYPQSAEVQSLSLPNPPLEASALNTSRLTPPASPIKWAEPRQVSSPSPKLPEPTVKKTGAIAWICRLCC